MELSLIDPEKDDYRPREGSAAEAYGCQMFAPVRRTMPVGNQAPPAGRLYSGREIQVGGLITENTTWDAGLVQVINSVEVATGVSLTITPGTVVEFSGYYKILVRGRLWAVGEPGNRIQFTVAYAQQAEGWDGLEFLNIPASDGFSRLEHCDLSFAVARPAAPVNPLRVLGGTARPETGGAVSIVGTNSLVITSCRFSDNTADYGGAIYCGYGSSPVVAGNLFTNNTAVIKGSVLFNVYAYPKLLNNTIAGNTCLAESIYDRCGAVDNFNGKILLTGNIIRDNFTNHYSGMQMLAAKDYYTNANNIQAYEGNGSNIDCDPYFMGGGEFPYELVESSCCIGVGVDHPLLKLAADFDIAGRDRVCGDVIDMGAFEFCGSASSVFQPNAWEPKLSLGCTPNPFNPRTEIFYDLPGDCVVDLTVYDLQGRHLRTLVGEHQRAGHHSAMWDGRDGQGRSLSSGTYLYQLRAGEDMICRSFTLVR